MNSHTMKSLAAAIFLPIVACAVFSSQVACAQGLPSVSYDGRHPVTLGHGDLSVTLDRAPALDGDRVPVVKGRVRGRVVFSFRIDDAASREPSAKARVVRLDPAAPSRQIVVTAFTGGPHCCTETRIVTSDAAHNWHVVEGQRLDGDDGYQFKDVDHDGVDELISYDISFLYAFASYADSFAPTRIARLTGIKIEDVTGQAKYRDFLRAQVREMEKHASSDPAQWHSNGFLAGWVAAKALVGEADEAWTRMLVSYDKSSDWLLRDCLAAAPPGQCPDDKKIQISFPEALLQHLADHEYPLPSHPDIPKP